MRTIDIQRSTDFHGNETDEFDVQVGHTNVRFLTVEELSAIHKLSGMWLAQMMHEGKADKVEHS